MVCEIFRTHTHTLRLVSPWGRPGNPAYPTEGHPMAKGHTLLPNTVHSTQQTLQEAALRPRDFRRLPYSLERLPYSPETSGGCPMARRLPLQSPQHTLASGRAYPRYPAYPASTAQTTRLQDCKYCQPTESITPRRGKIQRKP